MRRIRSEVRGAGFTLVELLIAMVVIIALVSLGFPALQQMIARSRVEGKVREVAVMCQEARMDAITGSIPTALKFDTTLERIYSWVDQNADGILDPGEVLLADTPVGDAVSFDAPDGEGQPIEGFDNDDDGYWITFNTDGSINASGEARFGDARGNYLQLRLWPSATGSIEITKWHDALSMWLTAGQEGQPWEWK